MSEDAVAAPKEFFTGYVDVGDFYRDRAFTLPTPFPTPSAFAACPEYLLFGTAQGDIVFVEPPNREDAEVTACDTIPFTPDACVCGITTSTPSTAAGGADQGAVIVTAWSVNAEGEVVVCIKRISVRRKGNLSRRLTDVVSSLVIPQPTQEQGVNTGIRPVSAVVVSPAGYAAVAYSHPPSSQSGAMGSGSMPSQGQGQGEFCVVSTMAYQAKRRGPAVLSSRFDSVVPRHGECQDLYLETLCEGPVTAQDREKEVSLVTCVFPAAVVCLASTLRQPPVVYTLASNAGAQSGCSAIDLSSRDRDTARLGQTPLYTLSDTGLVKTVQSLTPILSKRSAQTDADGTERLNPQSLQV
ncbi:hypothetical protein KIPB_008971 [Kipferlia bialata]|uniref:Uncharacterized protein n=1 Tax=Kipferlia bialata TaxID=797122 RepID=A0A9K3GK94_9EUKA|nr:hypothetical protein KIPB_008971 [Kipferlia bialata]|eukprot:g8971.t1